MFRDSVSMLEPGPRAQSLEMEKWVGAEPFSKNAYAQALNIKQVLEALSKGSEAEVGVGPCGVSEDLRVCGIILETPRFSYKWEPKQLRRQLTDILGKVLVPSLPPGAEQVRASEVFLTGKENHEAPVPS